MEAESQRQPKSGESTPSQSVPLRVLSSPSAVLAEEEARFQRRDLARWAKTGVPPRVFNKNLCFPPGHPAESLTALWKEKCREQGAITLTGPRGIGKSAWAAARVWEIWRGSTARYSSLIAMLGVIRDTWRKGREKSERAVMREFCEAGLLVVDEVGVQARSANEKMLLYEILVDRYEYLRPTILTTNLDPGIPSGLAELVDCLGPRVWDRIQGGWVDCKNWPRCRP